MLQPKITVLMPVYNGEKYLSYAIKSILNQTFNDFEFLIINDGSSDSSEKIILSYKDSRIKLINNKENEGLIFSLNKGIDIACGKYIARQDSDDISLPMRLEEEAKILDENPKVVLVSGYTQTINSKGENLAYKKGHQEPQLIKWGLLFCGARSYLDHSLVMYRKKQVIEQGKYSKEQLHCEDYGLWIRLSNIGNINLVPKVLLKRRVHHESISRKYSEIQKKNALNITRETISELIGRDIGFSEAERIMYFWKKINTLPFWQSSKQMKSIFCIINRLYSAFIKKERQQEFFDPKMVQIVKYSIGEKFGYYAVSAFCKRDILLGVRMLFYCVKWWGFYKTTIYCIKKICRIRC